MAGNALKFLVEKPADAEYLITILFSFCKKLGGGGWREYQENCKFYMLDNPIIVEHKREA